MRMLARVIRAGHHYPSLLIRVALQCAQPRSPWGEHAMSTPDTRPDMLRGWSAAAVTVGRASAVAAAAFRSLPDQAGEVEAVALRVGPYYGAGHIGGSCWRQAQPVDGDGDGNVLRTLEREFVIDARRLRAGKAQLL